MRDQPTWRIPLGILALVIAIGAYCMAVVTFVTPWIAGWHTLLQLPVYIALGVVWLLPLRRFLIWMETGRLS